MALFSKQSKPALPHTAHAPSASARVQSERVLVSPHATEKGMSLSERGAYTFRVALGATKPDVRRAVEKKYAVHVVSVTVARVRGKRIAWGGIGGVSPRWKKAVVTLRKGEAITF